MSLIFLVGPRACGKTTVGRQLAALRRVPFTDTDALIQERDQRSIADIVAGRCGYPDAPRGVIATGGGMVLAEENRRFLRHAGETVFLQAPAATLTARLTRRALPSQRPSLTGGNTALEAAAVLAERLPLYKSSARHWVDATLPIHDLCALLQRLCPE